MFEFIILFNRDLFVYRDDILMRCEPNRFVIDLSHSKSQGGSSLAPQNVQLQLYMYMYINYLGTHMVLISLVTAPGKALSSFGVFGVSLEICFSLLILPTPSQAFLAGTVSVRVMKKE